MIIRLEGGPVQVLAPAGRAGACRLTETAMQLAEAPALSPETLAEIEAIAVELARLAGAEIETTLGKVLAVEYKGVAAEAEAALLRDPVSEVDRNVETLIRARLADRFPGHDILGEESEERPGRESDFVWAIDPIDGTTNFVNGFPLFAASIGVLHRYVPVAGALWCSTSHALRPGVYHARAGAPLRFDEAEIAHAGNPLVRRWLAGEPEATAPSGRALGRAQDRIGGDRMRVRRRRPAPRRALRAAQRLGRRRRPRSGAGDRRRGPDAGCAGLAGVRAVRSGRPFARGARRPAPLARAADRRPGGRRRPARAGPLSRFAHSSGDLRGNHPFGRFRAPASPLCWRHRQWGGE